MQKGGFHLTKFVSNEREILKSLFQDDLSANCQSVNLDLDKIPSERALGILWNPDNDTIKVKAVTKSFPSSKRGLISFISSEFDALGLLTPLMLEAKLILQQLWKMSLDWDEKIPSNLNNRWLRWLQILKNIEKVKLPRLYRFSFKNIKNIELHVFADASSCAYGTVAYFCFLQEHKVECMFIASKSRLVPLSQKPSIPRLELQAAVIVTRLKNTIISEIPIEKRNTFLWTDSKIVLNYLSNNDTNFGVYIAHRINEIRQSTEPDNWCYIKIERNPADRITIYQDFLSLSKNNSWIFGPSFLKEEPFFEMSNNNIIVQTQQSNTQNKSHNSLINKTYHQINWSYYSSFDKLIQAISWIKNLKPNWIK